MVSELGPRTKFQGDTTFSRQKNLPSTADIGGIEIRVAVPPKRDDMAIVK
jgi:hypothetical protein